jgi:hypothetical protein
LMSFNRASCVSFGRPWMKVTDNVDFSKRHDMVSFWISRF